MRGEQQSSGKNNIKNNKKNGFFLYREEEGAAIKRLSCRELEGEEGSGNQVAEIRVMEG